MSAASKTNEPTSWLTKLSTKQATSAVLVLLSLVTLFVIRVSFLPSTDDRVSSVGKSVEITGAVTDDPDERQTGVRVTLGSTLVVLPTGVHVSYGDKLVVRGTLELPQSFETQTGHIFDYPTYLRARGVTTFMNDAKIVEQTPGGVSLVGFLYDIKHVFQNSLERVLPPTSAALIEGMLLGERGNVPTELLQAFMLVGLIHIVVLSGSNISIVSEAVFRALSFLPRRTLYIVGGITIILFAVMVGGGAATVRSVIMAALALLARYMRRPTAALRGLIVAGILMTLWNPLVVFDSGFVLSMLATFGLITIAPSIEKKLFFVSAWEKFNVRSLVATTLAVEIILVPALLYYSGVFSIVSLPINAIVLPFVPLIMFLGFITGMFALAHPILALVPALLTDLLLRTLEFVVTTVAALPMAYITTPPIAGWLVVLIYIPIISAASYLAYRTYLRSQTS